MNSLHWPAAVTILTVALLIVLSLVVGRTRARTGVQAPATTGHPDFERAFRAQMNTLEASVAFLPSLWLFALYASPAWSAALGATWLVGRIGYAAGYLREARRRHAGYLLSSFALLALAGGSAIGIARAFLAS